MAKRANFGLMIVVTLLIASSSMARVTINCTDLGNGVVELSYDASQETSPVRTFPLHITVSTGTITLIDNLSSHYWVYPIGSIIIDEECGPHQLSSPVTNPEFPGTLGGLGTDGITISLASMYIGEANAPPPTGVLLTFMISSECNVSVSEDTIRGGVMLDNMTLPGIYAPGVSGVQPPQPGTYDGGTGTINDPYLLSEPEQLNSIGLNPGDWHKNFKLVENIDMSGYAESNFNMIGTNLNKPFTGTFDGNNCKIYNFTNNCTDANFVGLFGCVNSNNAVVENLCLVDPNVSALSGLYVGSLVGCLGKGTISSCCAKDGSVSGGNFVGGLVGWNQDGTIINCYSSSNVQGQCSAGGLVGKDYKTISNSYSTGVVIADVNIVGGFVGYNKGVVSSSFWDVETSNQSDGAGETGESGVTGVTGETTGGMQTKSTFASAGWDFEGESTNGLDDIWTIREGQTYPIFTKQITKGDFIGRVGVDMADFAYFALRWGDINCGDSNDCEGADLDGYGTVDMNDLREFTNNWLLGVE